jgi:hypothetical protein
VSDAATLTTFGIAVALLAIGGGLGWFMGSQRQRNVTGTLLNRIADLTARYELRSADAERLMQRVDELGAADVKCMALTAQLEAERRRNEERVAAMQHAETSLREAFHAVSAVALRQDSESFLRLAHTSATLADAPEAQARDGGGGSAGGGGDNP